MNKVEYKKQILEAGKAEHQTVVNDFRERISAMQGGEMNENQSQDYQQLSMNSEMNQQIAQLADQLNFAVEELNLLNTIVIQEPLHDQVLFGSVVDTDQKTFFVSVSIDNFKVGEDKLFGLSTKTPLFKEMAGKKIGETFSFGPRNYKILDVY